MTLLTLVIVVGHGADFFSGIERCTLSAVNRDIRALIDNSWTYAPYIAKPPNPVIYTGYICEICYTTRFRITALGRCAACLYHTSLIDERDLTIKFALRPSDMDRYPTVGSPDCYLRTHVVNVSLSKWRGPRRALEATKPQVYRERAVHISRQMSYLNRDSLKWRLCVEPFLRNGKHGISTVQRRLEMWDAWHRDIWPNQTVYPDMLKSYMERAIFISNPNSRRDIIYYREICDRYREITTALSEAGLRLEDNPAVRALVKNYFRNIYSCTGAVNCAGVVKRARDCDKLFKDPIIREKIAPIIERIYDRMWMTYGYVHGDEGDSLYELEMLMLLEGLVKATKGEEIEERIAKIDIKIL